MKKKAFVNGKIFTSDREKPYAESFIAEDGYITWIGNREDMPGGEYEYVDLGENRANGKLKGMIHTITPRGS